jgi:hypothetical protein
MKHRTSRRFRPTLTAGIDPLESRQLLSSGFQVVTSPTVSGSSLNSVSAVSPTDIWAAGSQSSGPLIENFNGTSWSVVPSPTVKNGELSGVSALSSTDVWAVGSNGSGAPLVEQFNGTSWSVQTQPASSGSLAAVTAISPTDVWAVGGSGGAELIENFNGTSWSVVQAPFSGNASLSGISAISSTDVFAVGATAGEHSTNQVLQFNGTAWSELSSLPSGQEAAQAVDAISPTDVWTVGVSGAWNFNGTSWTQVLPSVGDLVAISGTSANNIFAVGDAVTPDGPLDGVTVVEQWNGTSWSSVTSANPGDIQDSLSAVTVLSNGTVVAVGNANPGGGFIETNATTAAPESVSRVSSVAGSRTVPQTAIATPTTSHGAAVTAPASVVQGPTSVALGVIPDDGTVQGPSATRTRR